MRNMHVLAAEMEAAGLYLEAMRAGKGALCLVTVVDNPYTGQSATPEERQSALGRMIEIALNMA